VIIGVDLMGSESSPEELFRAVLSAQEIPEVSSLVVFSTPQFVDKLSATPLGPKIKFFPAQEVIEMEEAPSTAIRRKKRSSMALGLKELAEKRLDAFVSSGNTGALVVGARIYLTTLPGVHRPGLLALLPTMKNHVAVIDVGGNLEKTTDSLVKFAAMGVAFQSAMQNLKDPTIGLLNIGVEAIKGTAVIKETYQALKETFPHFVGNVEGHEVFEGKVDLLITDGFTGNVFLKTAEGISKFILNSLRQQLGAEKKLSPLEALINYEEYPGALLCGVDGIVVKCHGYSSGKAMFSGIKGAVNLVHHKIVDKFRSALVALWTPEPH
jgi:glycerol-3-phosphate acyltransferase PlsX